jgi:hypothetical protein
LNVNNISDVRQIDVRMVEPLVPGPSRLKADNCFCEVEEYKSPSSDQIPAELIQAGGETSPSIIRMMK